MIRKQGRKYVVLSETTDTIDVLYGTMTDPAGQATGNSATVGIQLGAGVRSDLVGFDTERVVSTLTARFKPEVGRIASILLAGYYRGAAYLAHARPGRAYPPGPGVADEYNDDQWLKVKVIWKRRKKR